MSTPGSLLWYMTIMLNMRWLSCAEIFIVEFYGLTSLWRRWPNQEWTHSWAHIWWAVSFGDLGYGVMLKGSLWANSFRGYSLFSTNFLPWLIFSSVLQLLWRLWQLCSSTCSLPWWPDLPYYSARNSGIQCPHLKCRKSSAKIKLPVSWFSQTFFIETEKQ